MKITETQIRQIIREELEFVYKPSGGTPLNPGEASTDRGGYTLWTGEVISGDEVYKMGEIEAIDLLQSKGVKTIIDQEAGGIRRPPEHTHDINDWRSRVQQVLDLNQW